MDAFDSGRELQDFGAVEEHQHWLRVGCRRLTGCADTCDRLVQQWACHKKADCEKAAGGAYIRSYYIASTCGNDYGHMVRKCGQCGYGGPSSKASSAPSVGNNRNIKSRLLGNGRGDMV